MQHVQFGVDVRRGIGQQLGHGFRRQLLHHRVDGVDGRLGVQRVGFVDQRQGRLFFVDDDALTKLGAWGVVSWLDRFDLGEVFDVVER